MIRFIKLVSLLIAAIFAARAYDLEIVGRPQVRRAIIPSLSYFGGDVELLVTIKATDDNGKPVPAGTTVTLSATTRDGGLARLRAFGITDLSGVAIVRAVFDTPVANLKTSLVPCLVEPRDECGKMKEVDLTRHNDVEVTLGYDQFVQAGTQTYSVVGTAHSASSTSVLGQETDYAVRGRFVRNLLSLGRQEHMTDISASVEGGFAVNNLDIPLAPKYNQTGVRPGDIEFGVAALIWSRLVGSFGYAPVIGAGTGFRSASAAWAQPISARLRAAGGYDWYSPQTHAPGEKLGTMTAPMVELIFQPKSAANVFTARASYESTGLTIGHDSDQRLIQYAATRSPSAMFAWDFHRGGYFYTTFYLQARGITTGTPVYGFGCNFTLRNFANLR